MPNLFNSLSECLGFSQMIISTKFKILIALEVISSRFPIGVATKYKPLSNLLIIPLFITIISCAPVNYKIFEPVIGLEDKKTGINNPDDTKLIQNKTLNKNEEKMYLNSNILSEVELILPLNSNMDVTSGLINSFELAIYKKKIDNLSLKINRYHDTQDLFDKINNSAAPGKIYIGPLTVDATKKISNLCPKGIIFFSFASDRSLAKDCIYLINFFPEDELATLFNYFSDGSKIALLFPNNEYGNYINKKIDPIALESNSLVINRVSYNEDLTDARQAIKELGKYELRKKELERQKNILKSKNDEISKKALKKIAKFETVGVLDFTHVILPDYSIRLLEIAPLLPFL